jgi:hypothetical protein
LELAKYMDWPFQFWDFEDRRRINTRMEAVDTVGDSAHVIRIQEGDDLNLAIKRRFEAIGTSGESLGFPPSENMVEFPDDDPLESREPLASSRVSGDDFESYSQHHLKSTLLSNEVLEKYVKSATKLKRELADLNFVDNL